MPAKIDARSFNYAKQADSYLSLSSTGSTNPSESIDSGVTNDPAQSIWKDVTGNPDAVSSYIICLMAKLISLDSGQGLRPLPEVYKEITELQVDITKYKAWCNKEKPLSSALKTRAVRLQHTIVSTIYFLKQFYGFSPNLQLRNMYLRWNLARNQIAPAFEAEVLSPFAAVGSKDVRDLPASSPFLSSEISEEKLVKELINDCFHHQKRCFFGSLPPETCKLTANQAVSTSLSYVRLKDLLSRSPGLLRFAMDHISNLIQTGVSHTQDYGEREVLLPLLHLLKECITMMVDVDHRNIYKLLMPFYTWPASHSEAVKEILAMLLMEGKARGTLYRRTILQEHQLELNLRMNKPKQSTTVMLIDTTNPRNHGNSLYQSMVYHQEKPPPLILKRLLLCSVFHSLPPGSSELKMGQVDSTICKLSEENLTAFCEEGIDIAEQATVMETMEEAWEFLKSETSQLYQKILATLQDDVNATGEGSPERDFCSTSFVLPPPYIPVYQMEQNNVSSLYDKLQEVLTRLVQKNTDGPSFSTTNVESLMLSYPPSSAYTSNQSLPTSTRGSLNLGNSRSFSIEEYSNGSSNGLKSSADITSLDEGRHLAVQNGSVQRAISPTVRSDPGTGIMAVKQDSMNEPPSLSPIKDKKGSPLVTKSMSLSIPTQDNSDGTSQDSDKDAMSDTSSNKTGEEVISRISTDSSSTHPPSGRKLERRHTDAFLSSSSRRNLSIRSSGIYPGQIVSPTSSMGSVAIGIGNRGSVKQRANPSASSGTLKQRNRSNTVAGGMSIKLKGRMKKIKIVLAGDDTCISNTAKAYTQLRMKEPNLFNNLDIQFHYIPLSKAIVTVGVDQTPTSFGGSLELPEPVSSEQGNEEDGQDVMIGQYLSHMDSWYEQNVMLAVHNSLRLLINDSNFMPRSFSMLDGLDTRWLPLPTPSRVIVSTVANFLREAVHPVNSKIFRVKMTLRSDKAVKGFEHRESFMFSRIDIQRLSGKKNSRQAKPYESSVALTELALDNSFIKSDLVQMKDVWIIRGSNIPHPWDLGVPNPENECFELTIVKITSEGGRLSSTKHRVSEELQHHVYEMVVECGKEKPLSVIIDNDVSAITENVIRVEVSPAYIDQAVTGSTMRRTERHERQMTFPLMTYWPVDL